MTSEQRKKIISYDPKINVGHILTILVLLAGIVGAFYKQDSKISQETFDRQMGDQVLQGQMDKTTVVLDRLVDDVKDLQETDE